MGIGVGGVGTKLSLVMPLFAEMSWKKSDVGAVSVTGNRLPYAARHQGTLTLGAQLPRGFSAQLEAQYTGSLTPTT